MRVLIAVFMVIVVIFSMVTLVWYLTFGITASAPEELGVQGLIGPVSVEFMESGVVRIEATDAEDAAGAIGFAHSINHTWESLLVRQAALGRTAEWFGPSALPEDRLARTLQIATRARALFDALPESDQVSLRRYADGFNAGLSLSDIRADAPLVLLDVSPEKWEPWHSLAVERLWMWLGTDSEPGSSVSAAAIAWQNSEFGAADRALRHRLHLFGGEENLALALSDGDHASLVFRYVTGDSGLPVFQPTTITILGKPIIEGLSVPGTMFFPAGRNGSGAWITLLESPVSFSFPDGGTLVDIRFERIEDDMKREEVIPMGYTREGELVTGWGPAQTQTRTVVLPDSSGNVAVSWDGFYSRSDVSEWTRVLNGAIPSYTVFSRDGLFIPQDSDLAEVLGDPATVFSNERVTFISNSALGDQLASRAETLASDPTLVARPYEFLTDQIPAGSSEELIQFMSLIPEDSLVAPRTNEALSYLRSWDRSYDGSSIAASLSEGVLAYFDAHPTDSLTTPYVLAGMQSAIDTLTNNFGSDMRDWRWETVQNRNVYYPGDGRHGGDESRNVIQFLKEFSPVSVTGRGHPTTLSWGPSNRLAWRAASAVWNGSFSRDLSGEFMYTHEAVSYSQFLGRFLAENRSVRTHQLHPQQPESHFSRLTPVHE